MAAERRLPPGDEVVRLVREEGVSTRELAGRYGVTRQAVQYCLRANGVELAPAAAGYVKLDLPWKVRVEHNWSYEIRMLRALARVDAGLPVREDERRQADAWAEKIRREGNVVSYHPDMGFQLVPRQPSDGDELVRR